MEGEVRFIYSLLAYISLPIVLAWLAYRGLREPAYRTGWGQRLALDFRTVPSGCIWLHAASVGEVQAAIPLIHALREEYPDKPLHVTTITPTGRERLGQLCGEEVSHSYLPLDVPGAVRRFLNRMRPEVGVILEVELWPNLLYQLRRRRVPLFWSMDAYLNVR
ncbi:hypothetical protein CAI21_07895 [Alkalilimnicola ehrlichii]|uniref:3-deoxy-D-manno-octulosonic acid transferase n=1 Tax=Alkalilimnicola ehrlichii TaxID=351052 RepID=A0A3E0WWS8_9GAMM|nr:glycosyltransferase N-terminal domain-containing protein [Alkalilimnicola ehrlichii]RFA30112.1 hypothetical protein CAI21_07895 [Alkalilimnicola ehrlichii]RFA37460.1 hypothetical protein CAL65_09240 [Alkalilimnicola ehrlichii]